MIRLRRFWGRSLSARHPCMIVSAFRILHTTVDMLLCQIIMKCSTNKQLKSIETTPAQRQHVIGRHHMHVVFVIDWSDAKSDTLRSPLGKL